MIFPNSLMAAERTPDLSTIEVAESFFTECQITNSEVPIWPSEVTGFITTETKIFPLYDSAGKKIAFDIRVKVLAVGQEDKNLPVEGSFRLHIGFHMADFDDFLEYDERFQDKTPTSLLTTSLIGVAYSTARGMILSKVADTTLAQYGLPLRSARQLMSEAQVNTEEIQAYRAKIAELESQLALPAAEEQE